jgi:hypothetical protein
MFSRQDDFPLDWDPITVICGKSTGFCTPTTAKASWSLFTVLMSSGSMMPLTPGSSKSAMVDQQSCAISWYVTTLLKRLGDYYAEVADTRAEREKDANESTRNKRCWYLVLHSQSQKKRGLRVVGCLNFFVWECEVCYV